MIKCITRSKHWVVLLNKAKQDRDLASVVATDSTIADEIIGFDCQQAVEKSIKAVVAFRNVEYPLTHDIARLLKLLRDQPIVFPERLTDAAALTVFAGRLRYDELPDGGDGGPPFDRTGAIALATLAIDWAERFAKRE
jgi:HEPN domain-containing protein